MSNLAHEHTGEVSNATVFAYVRCCLTTMLDNLPAEISETRLLEAAIEQIAVRLAFAQSPDLAARHLGGTRRLLKTGGLQM